MAFTEVFLNLIFIQDHCFPRNYEIIVEMAGCYYHHKRANNKIFMDVHVVYDVMFYTNLKVAA